MLSSSFYDDVKNYGRGDGSRFLDGDKSGTKKNVNLFHYLSHSILDSFPQIVKSKVIGIISVVFSLIDRSPVTTKLGLTCILFIYEAKQNFPLSLRTSFDPETMFQIQSYTGVARDCIT